MRKKGSFSSLNLQTEDISLGIFVPEGHPQRNINICGDYKIQLNCNINDQYHTNMFDDNILSVDLYPVRLFLQEIRIAFGQ